MATFATTCWCSTEDLLLIPVATELLTMLRLMILLVKER